MFMRSAGCSITWRLANHRCRRCRACLSDPMQTINPVTGDKFSIIFAGGYQGDGRAHRQSLPDGDRFREALGWNVGLQPRVVTLPNPQVWLEPDTARAPVRGRLFLRQRRRPLVRGRR